MKANGLVNPWHSVRGEVKEDARDMKGQAVSSKIYTFTFSVPHHAREGDWWAEMLDNFEIVEVLSETAFLAVRVGRSRLLWFRLRAWIRRVAAAIDNKLEKSDE